MLSSALTKKNINLSEIPIFFPQGYEKVYLISYIFLAPYIVGEIFLFLYIANADKLLFLSLTPENFFIFAWAIGYEILITTLILYLIIHSFLSVWFPNKNKTHPSLSNVA